ncbi:MAG: hypothetical protein KatS3mg027_2302 [Bacteroidia bacterium]|nr:MAG: hypothetical protein KatS3mg027_2302 [Bacteroidia bacterium]
MVAYWIMFDTLNNSRLYPPFLLKNGRARQWLLNNSEELQLEYLLELLVGKEEWFEEYLFDVSFEHPGLEWYGQCD